MLEQGDLIKYTSPKTILEHKEKDDVGIILDVNPTTQQCLIQWSADAPRWYKTSGIIAHPSFFEIVKSKKDNNE